MEKLPENCLYIIAKYIADDFEDCVVRNSAALALVGNETTFQLSRMLWDMLEPGCLKANTKAWKDKMNDWQAFRSNYDEEFKNLSKPTDRPNVSLNNKVKELVVICERLGVPKSGTKSKLLDNITKAIDILEEQRQQNLRAIIQRYNTPPKQYTCPIVSKKYIDKIQEARATKIVATTAKKDYALNEDDLSEIRCKQVRNPHYSCAAPMRLYRVVDIQRYLSRKYGGYKAYLKAQKLKATQKEQRKATIMKNQNEKRKRLEQFIEQNNINYVEICGYSATAQMCFDKYDLDGFLECVNRYNELSNALRLKKCNLRNDSKLCQMYIDGVSRYTLEETVNVMEEMQFLFRYTEYKTIRDRIADELATEYCDYDGYVCWDEVNAQASEFAKKDAMKKFACSSLDILDIPERLRNMVIAEQKHHSQQRVE